MISSVLQALVSAIVGSAGTLFATFFTPLVNEIGTHFAKYISERKSADDSSEQTGLLPYYILTILLITGLILCGALLVFQFQDWQFGTMKPRTELFKYMWWIVISTLILSILSFVTAKRILKIAKANIEMPTETDRQTAQTTQLPDAEKSAEAEQNQLHQA
ncbi:hypothetical protein [Bifidobacterium thermophilum]|nr:hypothetical protein [Bifidobacterium thermophilum]